MASILFVYARTSIQAAKRNAQQHREADGGEINWHNESLRRHGKLEKPGEQGIIGELLKGGMEGDGGGKSGKGEVGRQMVKGMGETPEEKVIRERRRGGQ